MLQEAKGNMYDFITHTWNPIKGECPHGCTYCYMKRFYVNQAQPALHLDEREMRTDLGSGNYIFVGSSCDMWAESIPVEWKRQILNKCEEANSNKYLFQSKNPQEFMNCFGCDVTYCTTLETDYATPDVSYAPSPLQRAMAMEKLANDGHRTMVTIEPIMDFGLDEFVYMIMRCHPCQVNIGADSGHNGLPEPNAEKVQELIAALESKGLKVVQKRNLKRILGK